MDAGRRDLLPRDEVEEEEDDAALQLHKGDAAKVRQPIIEIDVCNKKLTSESDDGWETQIINSLIPQWTLHVDEYEQLNSIASATWLALDPNICAKVVVLFFCRYFYYIALMKWSKAEEQELSKH